MSSEDNNPALPRVSITYCTQCKWLLRAAYFGQELLSTFGTSIGEVALKPATGGVFNVYLTYQLQNSTQTEHSAGSAVRTVRIWDRKDDGGFPETKVLKQLVRNCIDPGRGLGHSDTPGKKAKSAGEASEEGEAKAGGRKAEAGVVEGEKSVVGREQECEDCK